MKRFEQMVSEIFENYDYDDIEIVLEKIKVFKQFIIFGAGQLGHKVYSVLADQGEKAALFCDNNLCGKIDKDSGLKIVSLNSLELDKKETFVLIAVFDPSAYAVVYRQLSVFGFEKTQMMNAKNMVERYPISYLKKNLEQYKKVYSLLQDDRSKETYRNMIKKAYLDSDISEIICDKRDAYFDEEMALGDDEVFVDCGGYDGDTAKCFIEKVKGRYKKLIILEPEADKERLIERNLKGFPYMLHICGAWSSSGTLRFNARGDSASYITENGKMEIKVKALDDIVMEDRPTFIKMDIEGAEMEALKGSQKIIQAYRPKLAICIYHRPEDLFEIPLFIKELREDYRLLIRQYEDSRFETVCYAI